MADKDGDTKLARILIVDASPDDAERALSALRDAGYALKTTHRIADAPALKSAAAEDWDLVLCELDLSAFNLEQVLGALRARRPFLPVIALTRALDDEALRRAMQAGIDDVVLKGQWVRFTCTVDRSLARASERETHAKTVASLQQLEKRYQTLVHHSREPIACCHDGLHLDANPAYLALFGYTDVEELKVIPVLNMVAKGDKSRLKTLLRRPAAGTSEELTAICRDGSEIPVEMTLLPIEINGEPCVQINVTDMSKRRALESKLNQMRQRDALTGLFNRHHFVQELGKVLERTDAAGSVVGIELLGLRDMNQTFGHAACDRVLLMLARELRTQVPSEALLARVGGGQFALLLADMQASQARELAQRLDAHIKGLRFNEGGQTLKYNYAVNRVVIDAKADRNTLLAGLFASENGSAPPVAQAPPTKPAAAPTPPTPAPEAPSLVTPVPAGLSAQPAAQAPAAKSAATPTPTPATEAPSLVTPVPAGLSAQPAASNAPAPTTAARPVTPSKPVTPSAPAAASGESEIDAAVRAALARDGLRLWHQPIMNMYAEPRDFNALLLYIDDVPSDFLRRGQNAELAQQVDRWQFQQAINQLAKLRRQGRDAAFFLRLSAQAIHDRLLLTAAQQHVKTLRLSAQHLLLQLSAALLTHAQATDFIAQARMAGFGVVLADFNAEAGTLAGAIEADFVRLDYSELVGDGDDDAAVRAAVAYAKERGWQTIADGVDTPEAFSLLWGCGVDYVQGDYLHPASAELNYAFEGEQTLTSDRVPSGWQVSA